MIKNCINTKYVKPILVTIAFVLTLFSFVSAQDGTIRAVYQPLETGDIVCASNEVSPSKTDNIQTMYWTRSNGVITNYFGTRESPLDYRSFCTPMVGEEMELHRCYRPSPPPGQWESIPSSGEFVWRKSGDVNFRLESSVCDTVTITEMDTMIINDTVFITNIVIQTDTIVHTDTIETIRIDTFSETTIELVEVFVKDTVCQNSFDSLFTVVNLYRDSLGACRDIPPSTPLIITDCAEVQMEGLSVCQLYINPTPVLRNELAILTVDTEFIGTDASIIVRDGLGGVKQTIALDRIDDIVQLNLDTDYDLGVYFVTVRFRIDQGWIQATVEMVIQ